MRTATEYELGAAFHQLGYDESFALIDTKLALGVATVAIAGGLFVLDKKLPFQQSYNWTVAAVVVYFIISSILYVLTHKPGLKNVKYVGYKGKEKVTLAGHTKGYDALYHVSITKGTQTITSSLPFTKFFDVSGYINRDALITVLKEELAKFDKKTQ